MILFIMINPMTRIVNTFSAIISIIELILFYLTFFSVV